MNFNKFGQFEMTNAQTKSTIGGTGTQNDTNQAPGNNLSSWTIPNANIISVSTISSQSPNKPSLTMT